MNRNKNHKNTTQQKKESRSLDLWRMTANINDIIFCRRSCSFIASNYGWGRAFNSSSSYSCFLGKISLILDSFFVCFCFVWQMKTILYIIHDLNAKKYFYIFTYIHKHSEKTNISKTKWKVISGFNSFVATIKIGWGKIFLCAHFWNGILWCMHEMKFDKILWEVPKCLFMLKWFWKLEHFGFRKWISTLIAKYFSKISIHILRTALNLQSFNVHSTHETIQISNL